MHHVYFETARNHHTTRIVFGDTDDLQLAQSTYTPPEVRPEYQRQLRRLEQEITTRGLDRRACRILPGLKVTPLHTFTIPALVTGLSESEEGVCATFLCADQDLTEQYRSVILDRQGRWRAPLIQGE